MNKGEQALIQMMEHSLMVDFWSNTITDPDGNEWYWNADEPFFNILEEVVKFREDARKEEQE